MSEQIINTYPIGEAPKLPVYDWTIYKNFRAVVRPVGEKWIFVEMLESADSFAMKNDEIKHRRCYYFDSIAQAKDFINAIILAIRNYEKENKNDSE